MDGLVRMAARVAGETVTLKGPFEAYDGGGGQGGHEVEDDGDLGFVLWHGDFTELAAKEAGGDPKADFEDFETSTEHSFLIELDWQLEAGDPSVGYGGGAYLEDWRLVHIDGVVLKNPEDHAAVERAMQRYVDANESDWAASYVEDLEDDYDPPDSDYGDYDGPW